MNNPKFRAWHKHLEIMADVLRLDFILDEAWLDLRYCSEPDEVKNKWKFQEIELMQWTGLTDAQDNMIYEGDIISHIHLPIEDSYIVKRLALEARFSMYGLKNGAESYYKFSEYVTSTMFLVKGNIYEPPNLLEGKE